MIWLLSAAIIIIGIFISLISWVIKYTIGYNFEFNYLYLLGKVGYDTYEPHSKITEWAFIDNYIWEKILLGNFGLATIQIGLLIGGCGYLYHVVVEKVRP